MTRSCLVLGGTGFIGSHLVRELVRVGFCVRVFGRDKNKFLRNVGNLENVSFWPGDIDRPEDVESALRGATDVIYLISSSVPATSMQDLSLDLQSNVIPLIRLLDAASRRDEIGSFVYVSSGGTVYGNPTSRQPLSESHQTQPISSYGLTKLVGEHYVRLSLSNGHIRSYIIRPSNAYGERQNLGQNQGAIGHFLFALATGKPITIYGDGGVVRDFIYASDLVSALRLCLDDISSSGGTVSTFNVGSGSGTSIIELVQRIEQITGQSFQINWQPDRSFDCRYNVLDTSTIRQAIGWRPLMPLDEGIAITWKWMQEQCR